MMPPEGLGRRVGLFRSLSAGAERVAENSDSAVRARGNNMMGLKTQADCDYKTTAGRALDL